MTQLNKKSLESNDSEQPPPYTTRTNSSHSPKRYDTQPGPSNNISSSSSNYSNNSSSSSSNGYYQPPSTIVPVMFSVSGSQARYPDLYIPKAGTSYAIPSAPSLFQPPVPSFFQPSAPQPPLHGVFQPPPPGRDATSPPDYDTVAQGRRPQMVPQPSSFGGLLSAASSQFLGPRDMHRPLLPIRTLREAAGEMTTHFVDGMAREVNDQRERLQSKALESIERAMTIQEPPTGKGHKKWEEKQKRGPLRFEEDWSGDDCFLKTANGPLVVQGTIRARRQIVLENKNGSVTVEGPLFSQGEVQIKVRQGTLQLKGSVQVGRLQILLRQAPVSIDSHLESKLTKIKTKNAPIHLTQVVARKRLEVYTNNSPITLHVVELDADSEIHVATTHAPVTVYVPSTFSGSFLVSTSSSSTALVSTRTHDSEMNFEKNETYKKEGTCKNLGNKSNGRIVIRTTHAPVVLYI